MQQAHAHPNSPCTRSMCTLLYPEAAASPCPVRQDAHGTKLKSPSSSPPPAATTLAAASAWVTKELLAAHHSSLSRAPCIPCKQTMTTERAVFVGRKRTAQHRSSASSCRTTRPAPRRVKATIELTK